MCPELQGVADLDPWHSDAVVDDRTEMRRLHRAPEAAVLAPLLDLATLSQAVAARVDARARVR